MDPQITNCKGGNNPLQWKDPAVITLTKWTNLNHCWQRNNLAWSAFWCDAVLYTKIFNLNIIKALSLDILLLSRKYRRWKNKLNDTSHTSNKSRQKMRSSTRELFWILRIDNNYPRGQKIEGLFKRHQMMQITYIIHSNF